MRVYSLPLKSLAFASVLLVGSLSASAQSAYFEAMTNLNPIVYFPLQETTPPPVGDVETNLGSLGRIADAVYQSTASGPFTSVAKNSGGVTSDGDTAVTFGSSAGTTNGGFLAVPTTDQRTAVTNPTFTVECWVNPANVGNNFEGIISKSGSNTGGVNGSNNQGGWCLSENYLAYLDSANMIGFDFHVYNGVGHGGAEVIVPFNVQANTWYHLVATYDGTNCWLYINGMNMIASGDGYQIPMAGSYLPDVWNQLMIGASRGLNNNKYEGTIDEVAVYTNVLSATQVSNHFAAASTSTSANPYSNTILADNPVMYYRMDSPGYTAPTFDMYPSATNYGTYSNSFGAAYGTASHPGVQGPQFAGMLDPNNGNQSLAVAINGVGGNNGNTANVPIGYTNGGAYVLAPDAAPVIITNLSFTDPNGPLLNPTNGPVSYVTNGAVITTNANRTPFSVTIWFKGNPHEPDRFQTIFGHSDSGWRMSMNTTGVIQWNPGPGGEVGTSLSYDDGNWHQFVGTYDGTNVLTYVDGAMVVATTVTNNGAGSPLYPMLGAPPDYLACGNNYGFHNGYGQRIFSGSIAHFAFFTNVLSATQVETLFSTAVTNQAPFIVGQPVTGRVNPAPAFLFFGVAAVGTGPLSYQWYYNAVSNYSGATQLVDDGVKYAGSQTTQVTVSNLVAADSGYYFVIVSNSLGSVTSRLASLVVNYTPVITSQNPAANFSLYPGQITTLSVTARADTNLSYYWFTNTVFNGTTASSLNIGPVTSANNGETFYCVVSNVDGTATSAPVTLTVQPFPAALTNSSFSSNILALNPTGYWPMHDAGQTPVPPLLETNYGSLGQIANAYWDDWRQPVSALQAGTLLGGGVTNDLSVLHGFPSAIAGDPDAAVQLSGANRSYLVIPRIPPPSPNTSPANFTLAPPFTLEAWVKPYNNRSFGIMLSTDQGTVNGGSVRGGFNWLYSGTANSFSITVYNGTNGNSTEPKTSANYPPGYWYHVVTTFDGTNIAYYINGVQDSLQNSSAATLNPNSWDPITIGCGRGLNANVFQGGLDELVVYTNILSITEIQKHYNDGTNAAYANYKQDVLENNPWLYYRMDSPTWSIPPTSSWPVLTNYGQVGLNGIYTPGAIPGGGPGPSDSGSPVGGLAANNSLQQNGSSIFADALNNSAYHPVPLGATGGRAPLSVAAWVKGDPANTGSQNWQGFVAQGDGGWRLNMNAGNPRANFNPGGAGGDSGNSTTSGTSENINDGNWHYVVGTYDGTNTVLWVDGLVSASNSSTAVIHSTNAEVFLGAYPANSVPSSTPNSLSGEVGRVFDGSICEAAYWNGVALKASQVQTLYSSLQVPPFILKQPISTSANEKANFTNSVLPNGTPPFTYQWYKDGLPMPVAGQTNVPFGATNASLILSPVIPSDQDTNYFVVVANAYGSVTSVVWALNPVFTLPHITNDIVTTNVTLFPGGHALFAITTIGAQPITYQWYSNNIAISGATASSYNLLNAQPPGSVQDYYCIASNFLGTTTSLVAQVTVITSPAASYPTTIIGDNPIGFWRLNEPDDGSGNNGATAFDYIGGNNGTYSNTVLSQPGYNTNCEPTETSAYFGFLALSNSMVYKIPTNVDFASTTNAEFSIECWANGFGQNGDNGIVDKGTGGGGEEFAIDTGSTGHAFRFYLRETNGTAYNVTTTNLPDGNWHHLVGVCDEANGEAWLYIDGIPAGSNTIPVGGGILATTVPMQIGARPTNNLPTYNNLQFVGFVSDVSAYSYALSYSQVLNHYFAACIPAHFVTQPTNYTAGQNSTATFSATVIGTPAISNQWFTGSPGGGTPIIGATNTTLVLSNVQPSDGTSYYLETANAYGTNDSTVVNLTVVSGVPQIFQNVPANLLVPEGATISIPVIAYGDEPLAYQWLMGDTNGQNFANLSATPRITGTQSNVLTINNAQPSDTGTYEVGITDDAGSTTSSICSLVVGPVPISFYGTGQGWTAQDTANYTAPAFDNGVLTLTDGGGSEARSAFFQFKQYIASFKASFIYQAAGSGTLADGVTFCLQNQSATARGGSGGSLGVSGITPSWEFEINIYPNNTVGFSINTNGAIGPNTVPGSLNFASGNPIQVTLLYAQNQMALTFTDLVAATTFTTTISVPNMPAVVGGQTAYVGFTGATGGSESTQTITDFKFIGIPTAAIAHNPPGSATVTWTGLIGGYVLMQSPSLGAPSWTPVTNSDTVVNSNHTVIVPITGGTNQFYRLTVPF